MTMLSKQERDELREAAQKATRGEWEAFCDGLATEVTFEVTPDKPIFMVQSGNDCPAITGTGEASKANALFIAASNPEQVLKLLDHIDALERDIAAFKRVRVEMLPCDLQVVTDIGFPCTADRIAKELLFKTEEIRQLRAALAGAREDWNGLA